MELLAPAGSFDTLRAAVQSGADAVYIGGSEFSARRSAVNFTTEEIKMAADYCHLRRVKLHVAANILVKEKETAAFLEYIKILRDAGVDAVIIQDIGMAQEVHRLYPDLPLHASTQMTIASVEGAQHLLEAGFSRIVLARELSCDAIREICEKVDIEIEVFAHGALCMCYSGQCLMSSIIGSRSGNRGMCAQPCRLPYEFDGTKGYLLSPKDLCLADKLSSLKKIGVTSLKIEGRLKRSEYTACVVGIYRKYIDNPAPLSKADLKELTDAFSRSGFTSGYFDEKLGRDMMCYDNPSNVSENIFTDEVKLRAREDANYRKSEIFMSCELKKESPLKLDVWDNFGNFVTACGEIPAEMAKNRPLSKERLTEQLLKLGNTPFFADSAEIFLEEGITIPISEINAVRRIALEKLSAEICKNPYTANALPDVPEKQREIPKSPILTAEVSTYEQAISCIKGGISRIYAPTALANRLFGKTDNVEIVAKLPPVCRSDRNYEKPKTDSIMISNIGQMDYNKKMYGDFRLNITNNKSCDFYDALECVTLSPELNLKELAPILGGEVIVYGRLPLMVVENCPAKALGKCQNFRDKHFLTDRKNERFPLRCTEGCTPEILNSKPIYMADKLENVKNLKINSIRLLFTVENSAECDKIIREYKMALLGEKVNVPEENTFTRGHFYRGVE